MATPRVAVPIPGDVPFDLGPEFEKEYEAARLAKEEAEAKGSKKVREERLPSW